MLLLGDQKIGRVPGVEVSASHSGIRVTVNGKPAKLAIICEDGHIMAAGDDVAKEAFAVAVNAYRNFLRGEGHLRTLSTP